MPKGKLAVFECVGELEVADAEVLSCRWLAFSTGPLATRWRQPAGRGHVAGRWLSVRRRWRGGGKRRAVRAAP